MFNLKFDRTSTFRREKGYWGFILFLAFISSCSNPQKAELDKVDFNFHVRPILSDKCWACHGPDDKARKANLRLDVEEFAFALLDTTDETYAIKPGNTQESSLIHRIYTDDPEQIMPPPESNLSLTEREKEILTKWIEQGAEWKPHWAFQPPKKADVPEENFENDWISNPIDYFLLAKMKHRGFEPAERASKEKLIRRLSFDLRGLPPSVEEIDSFLKDDSKDAWEKLVDKFLDSEDYGERMTLNWLDLARYADSHGYQDDIERSMWPWRDWVINSFNENMPYDSFLIYQLAGDLLENSDYEKKLATGFNRNHMITQEVGVIDEEYRVQYVVDRVNTFSTGLLGLTMDCARCHDHKYDPFSQREYYQLYDFFNRVPEKGRVDYGVEVAAPSLKQPEEKVNKLKEEARKLVVSQKAELENYKTQKWNDFNEDSEEDGPSIEKPLTAPEGLSAWFPFDYMHSDTLHNRLNPKQLAIGFEDPVQIKGKSGGAIEFSGWNHLKLDNDIKINLSKSFSISFFIKSLYGGIRGPVVRFVNDDSSTPDALEINVGSRKRVNFVMRGRVPSNALSVTTEQPLPGNKWIHITITYDGRNGVDGVNIYNNGESMYLLKNANNFKDRAGRYHKVQVGRASRGKGLVSGQVDELMFFNKELSSDEVMEVMNFDFLNSEDRNTSLDEKRKFMNDMFTYDTEFNRMTEWLGEFKIREVRTSEIITAPTMVMKDVDTLRDTYILTRGQYDAQGQKVEAGTPSDILPLDTIKYSKDRLGLAQWLFDEKNPLTARVAVNRYWQMIFGRGLVETPEDFGSQGALPSHPELLDWLSVEFIENDWDIKHLIKLIVTSSAYKQSTFRTEKHKIDDPDNILLSYRSKQRLPAEFIRDHGLSVSGLLAQKVGGPSVKPYQPEGLWLETASGNQSLRKYIQDHRDDLYRKSIYTFWKRTVPFPSMMIFDASERGQCIVERQSTTTPLQAMVLLNDPQYIEISRIMANRAMDTTDIVEEQIIYMFRLATSRKPDEQELGQLTEYYNDQLDTYNKDKEGAIKLLKVGEYRVPNENLKPELAAMSMVANTIFNLTESISKN